MRLPRPKEEDLPLIVTENGNDIPVYALLDINTDHPEFYLRDQCDWQALVSYQHGLAKLRVEHLEDRLEAIKAEVYQQITQAHQGSKATVDYIKSLVTTDTRVLGAKSKIQVAKEREMALESMRWAMQTRKEMLIQLGADTRLERKLLTR
jgi:hypothetical protein